jgi:Domain of unknown function (DUF4333)
MKRSGLYLLVFVTASGFAGCSSSHTIAKQEVAKQAQVQFDALARRNGKSRFPKIACPNDLDAKVGGSTRCSASSLAGTLGITVTVKSISGSTAHLIFKGDNHLTK